MLGRFAFLGIVALGIYVYASGGGSKAATAQITQSCDAGAGVVSARFAWPAPAAGALETWLDVGIAPGFPAGAYRGHGPLAPDATSYTLGGLPPGVRFYYRINARYAAGWRTAAAGSFASGCGAAAATSP